MCPFARRRTGGWSPASGSGCPSGPGTTISRLWSASRARVGGTSPGVERRESGDVRCRRRGERGGEHRGSSQHRLVIVGEETEAPVQRRADRPVPVVEPWLRRSAGRARRSARASRPSTRGSPAGPRPARSPGRPRRAGCRSTRSGAGRRRTARTSRPSRPARRTGHRVALASSAASREPGHGEGRTRTAAAAGSAGGQHGDARAGGQQPLHQGRHPVTRCSQLSSTSSDSVPASFATRVSVGDLPGCSPNPKAVATATPTIVGSVTGTRSTYHAPSA